MQLNSGNRTSLGYDLCFTLLMRLECFPPFFFDVAASVASYSRWYSDEAGIVGNGPGAMAHLPTCAAAMHLTFTPAWLLTAHGLYVSSRLALDSLRLSLLRKCARSPGCHWATLQPSVIHCKRGWDYTGCVEIEHNS